MPGRNRQSSPIDFENPPQDKCLCNSMRIRSGAKILALLDLAASLVVLVASVWEYAQLKYVKPYPKFSTPILDSIFVATVMASICLAFAASLLLIDALADRGSRYRCLIEIYVLRRAVSFICLPTGVLISVIGLIGDHQNETFLRRGAAKLAAEMFDSSDFAANRRSYIDALLGGLLTVCVLSLPFDIWTSLITFRYYRYARARERCRRLLNSAPGENGVLDEGVAASEMGIKIGTRPSTIDNETATEITMSETDFNESLDVNLLT